MNGEVPEPVKVSFFVDFNECSSVFFTYKKIYVDYVLLSFLSKNFPHEMVGFSGVLLAHWMKGFIIIIVFP